MNNQYVGNRYVPKPCGVWDSTKQTVYESLSVVLWEGNSYTSKQAVPIGTDISNLSFWVRSADYNAQIAIYEQNVQDYHQFVLDQIDIINDDNETFKTEQQAIYADFLVDENANFENFKTEFKADAPYRTPEDYGALGNNIADDSQALLDAMNDCSNNGYTLMLKGKYRVSTPIVYNGNKSLLVIGSVPNYFSLIADINNISAENCNIFFDSGATLEINKFGSVTFFGVGFSSIDKATGTGILLKSFHNKFLNCSFSQINKAIYATSGALNWLGENQVLNCGFYKCGYAYYADAGSDSDFIGNLIHGTCDVGFYGSCAGYQISENHFYAKQPSYFQFFNTKITNNYIQEIVDNPSIILDGSFGCLVGSNQFELYMDGARTTAKGLIGLTLKSGQGNVAFIGNGIHGKSLAIQDNLAFIYLLYSSTKYDMPLFFSGNNFRCLKAIFNETYPQYNIRGSLSYKNIAPTIGSGTLVDSQVECLNGIVFAYVKISAPTLVNSIKLPNSNVPYIARVKVTRNDATTDEKVIYMGVADWIPISNYAEANTAEVWATYPLQHSTEIEYKLA